MLVEPIFADWAIAATSFLLSRRELASWLLDDATLVVGDEDDLPTVAPSGTIEKAEQLLEAIAVHAGREHVEHVIVDVSPDDDALEPTTPGDPVAVALPASMLWSRDASIAFLARGVVAPIVIDVADRGPRGRAARGAMIDVATVLAGFGVPIIRAYGATVMPGATRLVLRADRDAERMRDLDGLEVTYVHAIFEVLHDADPDESDSTLSRSARECMREARRMIAPRRPEIERARAIARGEIASYRDR